MYQKLIKRKDAIGINLTTVGKKEKKKNFVVTMISHNNKLFNDGNGNVLNLRKITRRPRRALFF